MLPHHARELRRETAGDQSDVALHSPGTGVRGFPLTCSGYSETKISWHSGFYFPLVMVHSYDSCVEVFTKS